MRFDVLTLFPELFQSPLKASILGRALSGGFIDVELHDIREHTTDKHRSVDDSPFGGGAGMVMMPGPVVSAIESVKAERNVARTILLSPSGRKFDQAYARELALIQPANLLFICGRYEGVDSRVAEQWCDEELSIGDYVLSGGELAALAVIDTIARLIPGVLGNDESNVDESMEDGLLEYPHYTRPRSFRDLDVPSVLLSGNHRDIAVWRRKQSLERTQMRRPDLFNRLELSVNDKKLLDS
ncbi:MAG TPA: tRNA (guanosine(37)-N1)-methyltransferase TrmD [Myxococcales bacterium]|nr:tRNA (guanosine(37)-N1)-methyltransferase TrmD [Myxococcales bacterium]HIN86385.1 tRNA (guanosine(37)-N1)-methyltransferase TrmD [Myxococcales bacterium]